MACVVVSALPAGAGAEQASEPASPAARKLDAGGYHGCAVLVAGSVRCWGFGANGQLGYGNTGTIGDDESPASVGPVNLGAGLTVTAVAAGDFHTCAVVDRGTVRCWGLGGDGRLGYANTNTVGDPSSVGAVDLGLGHTAKAITAGSVHTCALLDDDSVRCWGFGFDGRLGTGTTSKVGDNETPDSAGRVDLGTGHSAKAISAGDAHTCAVLEDGSVRCWGLGGNGRLGYGNESNVGDYTTPDSAGPVSLGRKAVAISAGGAHTCAVLDDGSVRCWGYGGNGRLGYANTSNVGDTPSATPDKMGPVSLGTGRQAIAISAGEDHTCALLDNGTVRCWGYGADGRLGYGNQNNIGDHATPDSAGPVSLGRKAVAISAGRRHTCARLDDDTVRCWGYGGSGRLGYCNQNNIGDDESPSAAGPVALETGGPGAACGSGGGGSPTAPAAAAAQSPVAEKLPTVSSEAVRAHGLRTCLAAVASHAQREKRLARRGSARQRAKARRHLTRHAHSARRRCLRLFARTPGRVTGLRARTHGKTQIELSFYAAGTDANHPPPARSYVVKQSRRPIHGARGFARAQTLCKGACRFTPAEVGGKVSLTVTDLKPHTTYYYVVAARDNVSAKRGPRSQTAKSGTR